MLQLIAGGIFLGVSALIFKIGFSAITITLLLRLGSIIAAGVLLTAFFWYGSTWLLTALIGSDDIGFTPEDLSTGVGISFFSMTASDVLGYVRYFVYLTNFDYCIKIIANAWIFRLLLTRFILTV